MNTKRSGLFLLLALMFATGNAFAHDKGDLMLNIEPQIGLSIPSIQDLDTNGIGIDVGLRTTLHYYFVSFFSLNAGLGLNFFYEFFSEEIESFNLGDYETMELDFGTLYLSIPFGFRFSASAFAAGAGLMINIPLMAESTTKIGDSDWENVDIDGNTYLGWYVDIGFDLSGIKEKRGGFGLLTRLSGSFTDSIFSAPGNENVGYSRFSVSLLFQAAIQLANLPIGGK